MRFLADENVDTATVRALADSGHDVLRVVDEPELGESAPDVDVLATATRRNRILLTGDTSDFEDPPTESHAGIVLVTDGTLSGREICRGIRRIERHCPELDDHVAYLTDWL